MEISALIKIKTIRKQRKFSQQYMADQLRISQMAYSKIESNKTHLNWEKLNKIAKILRVDIWNLIDETKDKITPEEKPFLENIKLLDSLYKKHEDEVAELKKEIKSLKIQLKAKE